MMAAVDLGQSDDRRKRVGRAILTARTEHGWTQPELAELLTEALRKQAAPGEAQTVGQSAVSRWEQGVNGPEPWKLPVVEQVLELPAGTLAALLYEQPPAPDRATQLEARLDRVELAMMEMLALLRDLDRRIQGTSRGGDEEG